MAYPAGGGVVQSNDDAGRLEQNGNACYGLHSSSRDIMLETDVQRLLIIIPRSSADKIPHVCMYRSSPTHPPTHPREMMQQVEVANSVGQFDTMDKEERQEATDVAMTSLRIEYLQHRYIGIIRSKLLYSTWYSTAQ